ncbi:type IV secretion system protein [Solirubrobacter sp. CPCC 204708]|uniref:Type IV secretion system protein n=1 Tax=Solirubrobacter deserti TaxID=2282478 RepID=A0ABT4RDF7_9ACTN|nr:type IV secretion system protein [Solirubrobacter deserti]MBE2317822.1 type IV secretion system protein [Solirubrobacter deserti]MDA0136401.1 type IV secretion system protein [Solirubrobacter deserti]
MTKVLVLALALVLLAWPGASAEYRGSDLLGNVSPQSQVDGGLADRYPLSAYALDYHVDVGVTEPEGIPPMIAQWAAAQIWSATSLLVKCTIDLLTWAFSLDLLNGGDGALKPIGDAITNLYENVIGQAWIVVAILVAGIWAIWKALVQRRYTETAGALAVSVLFVLLALFFVYQPERTVGQASQWTNQLSNAFLSGANSGSLDDPQGAKRQVADHLFETLVVQPWAVLQFGGLTHCVDTDRLDDDGFPRPVSPHDPARDVCRDHLKQGKDGHGGYASRYLAQRPGSEERKAEYDALREGQAPNDPQFRGYQVDKADAPAVDAQQAGGAYQRLTFSVVVLIGALGAVALLGFLSLAVILAQVVALVLLGFAPVALIVGIFPGAGHAFFKTWLSKLATAIFIKALYSLVIAIVLAVSAALTASTGSLGFLLAFGLQTIFFWAIFLYRKQITGRLVAATSGSPDAPKVPRMTVVQKGAVAASHPFTALAGVTAGRMSRQESALAGSEKTRSAKTPEPAPAATTDHASASGPNGTLAATDGHVSRANDSAPAASKGHSGGGVAVLAPPSKPAEAPSATATAAPAVVLGDPLQAPASSADSAAASSPATPPRSAPATREPSAPAAEPTPRDSHEDVMRRARELRERPHEPINRGDTWDRA